MADKFKVLQPWLTLLSRLILGVVLLVAGGLKIGNLPKSANCNCPGLGQGAEY